MLHLNNQKPASLQEPVRAKEERGKHAAPPEEIEGEVVVKNEPTAEELAECPNPRYVQKEVPLTEEQIKRREKMAKRVMQLRAEALRDFDIGDAISAGAYEVP